MEKPTTFEPCPLSSEDLWGKYVADRPIGDELQQLLSAAAALVPGAPIPFQISAQPANKSTFGASPNYAITLPGAGDTNPPFPQEAQTLFGLLGGVMTIISAAMAFLGPIKLIIAVIIGIVNVFCAFPDPIKIIAAIVQLLLLMIPLVALFPPFAALVMLFDMIKAALATFAALLLELLPKIDLIIENTTLLLQYAQDQRMSNAAAAANKICGIVYGMLNDIAVLAPINSILQLISALSGAGVGGICGPDSECCEECPVVIAAAPTSGNVVRPLADTVELVLPRYTDPGAPIAGVAAGSVWNTSFFVRPGTPTAATPDLGAYLSDIDFYARTAPGSFSIRLTGLRRLTAVEREIAANNQTTTPTVLTAQIIGVTATSQTRSIRVQCAQDLNIEQMTLAEILVDENVLLRAGLMSVGCTRDVRQVQTQLSSEINRNAAAVAAFGVPGATSLSGIEDRFGLPPGGLQINIDSIRDAVTAILDDPTAADPAAVVGAIQTEIDRVSQIGQTAICYLADPVSSTFEADATVADLGQQVRISLTVRDSEGNAFLRGLPASIGANVIFTTTSGQLTQTTFDSDTGTHSAILTVDRVGGADVSAYLLTSQICMIPQTSRGGATRKVTVTFIDGNLRPRRQTRQYVQSVGGRRR